MTALPDLADILLERRKFTLFVTFNRPQAKNALTAAMIDGLFRLCDCLEADRTMRALVLRGAGGAFCAGGDIKDFAAQLMTAPPREGEADPVAKGNRRFGDLLLRLDALPQVVIAAIEGPAFGGAMGFIAVSDVAIASDDARFSLSETTLGLPPAQIGPFVVRKIGLFHARRFALTGARFGAAEAKAAGLIDTIAAPGGLDLSLNAVLDAVGRCEPGANAATKKIFNAAAPAIDRETLDAASVAFATCLRGKGREGASAFAAKMPPPWLETCTDD